MTAAVITGASAGLGAEFTRQLVREFPEIEEFWLIARRVGKLEELAQQFPDKKRPKTFPSVFQRDLYPFQHAFPKFPIQFSDPRGNNFPGGMFPNRKPERSVIHLP